MRKWAIVIALSLAACVALFHILWWEQYLIVRHDRVFFTVDMILLIANLWLYIGIVKNFDDPFKSYWQRWLAFILTALLCIWAGIWLSQYKMDKSDNIAPTYQKAK